MFTPPDGAAPLPDEVAGCWDAFHRFVDRFLIRFECGLVSLGSLIRGKFGLRLGQSGL